MKRAREKDETTTFRISKELKEAARLWAKRTHRSMSQYYCFAIERQLERDQDEAGKARNESDRKEKT